MLILKLLLHGIFDAITSITVYRVYKVYRAENGANKKFVRGAQGRLDESNVHFKGRLFGED